MALLEHDAARAVDHVRRHLEAAVRREAVQEVGAGGGLVHQRGVDGEALEGLLALLLVGLLPHRHPRVRVHERGAVDGLGGTVREGDVAEQLQALALDVVPLVAERAGEPDARPEQQADLGERAGDVVVVADVGDALPGERAADLLHREGVGDRLQRVGVVGQQVDDRDVGDGDHPLQHAVLEDPRGEDGVVALQDPRDVLDGLPGVEADLLAARVDRVPAELHDGHLRGVAGPRRRLLEDQRRAEALERATEVGRRDARRGRAPCAPPRRSGRRPPTGVPS